MARKPFFQRRALAALVGMAALAAVGVAGVGLWPRTASDGVFAPRGVDESMIVELGQFAAPVERRDGETALLLVDARVEVTGQALALDLSRNMPALRHAALRAVHGLAAKGEAAVSVETARAALERALVEGYGAPVDGTVYLDRLLIQ